MDENRLRTALSMLETRVAELERKVEELEEQVEAAACRGAADEEDRHG